MNKVTDEMVRKAGDTLMQHGLNAPEQAIYQAARAALEAALTARVAELEAALRKAEKALIPFYNAVFNDNGDITVTGNYDYEEAISGYFAYRRVDAALAGHAPAEGEAKEPVAWQHRLKTQRYGVWSEWTEWLPGMADRQHEDTLHQYEDRPLYAHPPAEPKP